MRLSAEELRRGELLGTRLIEVAKASRAAHGGSGAGGGSGADGGVVFLERPGGGSGWTMEGGAGAVLHMNMAQDIKQTTTLAPVHGSSGFITQVKAAGEHMRAAELLGVLPSGEESGFPRDSAAFNQAQACHEFGEQRDAWVTAPGETLAVRRTIGWLVNTLRPLAKGDVWQVIHNRSGLTTFDSHGYSVQIVNKGDPQPAPFAGAKQKMADTSAARALRAEHVDLARVQAERNPTYRLHFVDAGGRVTSKSGLLDRAACLEALREGGFGADPGRLLCDVRNDGIASLTIDDSSVIVTRVLGTSGNDVDVVAVTDDNGRHTDFINQIPQAQRSDMRPRFCAFLTPEGFEMLKLESAVKAKGKPGWLPRGWHIFEGVDLLCTGVKASKAEVDDITGFFKGKEGCPAHASVTGNAQKSGSGISGCRYFEAHYYACDGTTQPAKGTRGSKVAKTA